jgi:hypothetical protein
MNNIVMTACHPVIITWLFSHCLLLSLGQKMTILVGTMSAKVHNNFHVDGAVRLTDFSCGGTSCRQHGPYTAIPLQASKRLLLLRILAMPYAVATQTHVHHFQSPSCGIALCYDLAPHFFFYHVPCYVISFTSPSAYCLPLTMCSSLLPTPFTKPRTVSLSTRLFLSIFLTKPLCPFTKHLTLLPILYQLSPFLTNS